MIKLERFVEISLVQLQEISWTKLSKINIANNRYGNKLNSSCIPKLHNSQSRSIPLDIALHITPCIITFGSYQQKRSFAVQFIHRPPLTVHPRHQKHTHPLPLPFPPFLISIPNVTTIYIYTSTRDF